MNNTNDSNNLSDVRVLDYKNQDPFFIDYYKYRNDCIRDKALILTGTRKEIIISLNKFLDYTVDYIREYNDKMEELEDLLKVYDDLELKEFRERINSLWKSINSDHVLFEILPKPNYNSEEDKIESYWRNEKHKGLRELKKVMCDIYKLNN